MLLDNEGFDEREDRKVKASWKATKRTMGFLSMISKPICFSFFQSPKPTNLFYVLEGEKPFKSPGIHNLEINKADWLSYSGYVVHR